MLAWQTHFLLSHLPSSPKVLSPNSHSTDKWSLRRATIQLSFNTIFYHTYIQASPGKEHVECPCYQVWVTGLLENCFLPSSDWLGAHHPQRDLLKNPGLTSQLPLLATCGYQTKDHQLNTSCCGACLLHHMGHLLF